MPTILDISYCQPIDSIDWPRLKALGVAVIIRAGQGAYEDNLFRQHYANAIAAGVPAGMYWFLQPDQRPEYQSAACIAVWKSLAVKPRVIALDVENIAYTKPDGSKVNILPPSVATSTQYIDLWLISVEQDTGITPMIYTRKDYWEAWTTRSSNWKHYPLWLASWTVYSFDIRLPVDWPTWQIWQYGSGDQDGSKYRVDLNEFDGSQAAMFDFFGGVQPMSTKAYTTNPAACDRVIAINSADARATVSPKDLGVGAMVIRAGGATGPNFTAFQDTAWDQRQKSANADGVRVALLFELDPAWYRANEVDEAMVTARSGHPERNPVLLKFLQCLHTNSAATWEMMQASQPADWRPVQAVMFSQYNTLYQGADVGEIWFSLSITDILNQVKFLMDTAKIPALPIVLETSPELLAKYQQQLAVWLAYRPAAAGDAPARSSWLYLAYGGSTVWTLFPAHTDIPDLATCWPWSWANIDLATYAWKYIPDGYAARVVLHETTDNRMYVPTYTDSLGVAQPVDLYLAPIPLYSWMNPLAAPPPPPTTGPDLTALTARVTTLETSLTALTAAVQQIPLWDIKPFTIS